MNIIKIQDMLRSVPDNSLIGYVQNPQGEVPSYLALSELQRRKDTRAKFQQQQTPETSVAEDLGQEAAQNQGGLSMLAGQPQQDMAEQGVASLPVDEGMYNEQNFASGGIVAFADGGDTGMNLDTSSSLNLNLAGKPSDSESDGSPMGAYSPNMGMPGGVNGMGYGNSNLLQALFGGLKREPESYALNVNTGKQEPQYAEGSQSMGGLLDILRGLGGLNGLGYSPLGVGGVMGPGPYGMNPIFQNLFKPAEPKSYSLNVNSGKQEAKYAQGGMVAFAPGGSVYPNYEGPATSAIGRGLSSITGGLKGYVDKKSQLMELQREIERLQPNLFESLTPSELSTKKAKIAELKAQQDAIRNPSSGYVYKEGESAVDPTMKSYVDQEVQRKLEASKEKPKATIGKPAAEIKGDTAGNAPAQQPAESDEDYLRRRMALYKEFMGPNEDRTKLQDKIDAMEKRAARQEEMAPWMALTEAGFKTMAGTSPFALTNLGAGAEAGVKSYGAAQDKMAALEEKRYTLMNDAAKADRAEKQAIVKFGFESEEAKAIRDQKERLGQEELKIRREANRLTKDFNTARLGALTTGKTTKAMADLIQKTNAPIDKKLATLVMAGGKSKEVQDMIKSLQAEKLANENKIRAYFAQDGLAGTETSATNADPLGIL
jgi:hypothetical protein